MEEDRRTSNGSQRARSATAPKSAINDGQGTRNAPVVVDDDDEEEAGPAGVANIPAAAQPPLSQSTNGRLPPSSTAQPTTAAATATATNGVGSAPAPPSSAPRWEAASAPLETCAFCGAQCGSSSLRACAEARGGRKALKALIRQLDDDRDSWQDDVKSEMHARMGKLYDLYQSVSPLCILVRAQPVLMFASGPSKACSLSSARNIPDTRDAICCIYHTHTYQ